MIQFKIEVKVDDSVEIWSFEVWTLDLKLIFKVKVWGWILMPDFEVQV